MKLIYLIPRCCWSEFISHRRTTQQQLKKQIICKPKND